MGECGQKLLEFRLHGQNLLAIKTKKLDDKRMWGVVEQIERAGGRVVESKEGVVTAELCGVHEDIEKLIEALGPEVLKEVARSGQVLISRETT